ncbi:S8 family serine peptidase [Chloracidobacterium aggregatum]|uniref:S8 family serine peptidase n=1 Tax=Chloracidobacterium sp. N TaxID=2821540 RepID=A0ABX8B3G1_9BACT|nr:S8 family serine peptidase [Chloracidobacterium aggregatum]QUV86631.1 S8 family serine peptidase [Chloracidobacterium sp. 2]QUV92253.1 S8 family serine peptidase [Chloracidobacterium sp. A]QUV95529.1 S8 family serine peptidase [Chloracidobacterium sp. N]QUV98752.1 S8 family serine peptidase [Chloracidobacterium sp. E]
MARLMPPRRLWIGFLVGLLVMLVAIGLPVRQQAAGRGYSITMSEVAMPTDFTISIGGFCFDPRKDDPARALAARGGYLTEAAGDSYQIVQFNGRAQDAWLAELRQAGIEPLQYIPHQAYLAYVPAAARETAARRDYVRWMGLYQPAYKLSPALQWLLTGKAGKPSADGTYLVATFKRSGLEAATKRLENVGKVITVETMPAGAVFDVLRVRLSPAAVIQAAQASEVMAIEPYVTPTPEDERNAHVTAGNYTGTGIDNLAAPGYNPQTQFGSNGSGITVGVVDDGVEIPSPQGFYITTANAVAGPPRGADSSQSFRGGHGHLCASIIAGTTPFPNILDPRGYNYGLGVAPGAHIVSVPLITGGAFQGGDVTAVNDTVTTLPPNGIRATISNNSWGAGVATDYGTREAQYDAFTRDASQGDGIDPLLFVFSSGNNGPGSQTLTRPKAAKNVITVGSSVGLRPELPSFQGVPNTNIDFISNYSSRGPAADGRIKPDVCAPGQQITGPQSASNQVGFGTLGDGVHIRGSGTSFAAPHVSGAAAVFSGWWRATNAGQFPAPALIKAALINGAVDMNAEHPGVPGSSSTEPIPNIAEGWGRINLRNSIPGGVPTVYVNENVPLLDNGQTYVFTGQVANGGQPLRVTLVYTDVPGAPGANPALVNDLDLSVSVGGQTYRGNVFANGLSTPGGNADNRNNVENVFLPPQPAGTPVVVRVAATALNGDGIPGNSDTTDQHFALVIRNAVASTPTTPLLAVSNVMATEVGGNGNGFIEPCEQGSLMLGLRNDGTPATGLSATLTALTPGVSILSGTGTFANIGQGQSVTGPTPAFRFLLGPTVPCGQVVQFQLTVNFAGGGSPFVTTVQVPTGGNNYVFTPSGGATIPAGGQLVAGSQLDDALIPLTAPFAFSIYGTNVAAGATVTADTNGVLRLAGGGGSVFENTSLPFPGFGSAPALCVFWDDIDLRAQQSGPPSGIFTQVTGSAPNRQWIIEWRGVRFGTSEEIRVAVVLQEGTNRFEYRYAQTGPGNGNSATVGVQATGSGSLFTQFSFDQPNVTPGLRLEAQLGCGPCVLCEYAVSPSTLNVGGDAVPSVTVTVTTGAGCAWEATVRNTDAPWVKLVSAQLASGQVVTPRMVGELGDVNRRLALTGTGSATVTLAVGRNPGGAARTGTVLVAGQVVTVTQAGGSGGGAPLGATMAMFRPSNGYMYLKNRLISDFADQDFFYGTAGDVPVAGDWDSDGIDTPGIYRNVNGVMTFFLINNNTGGFADVSFAFGQPGDIPIAGDWDGNGTVTCGVYRPGSQTFFLRNANTGGNPDLTVVITGAQASDRPVAGRWVAGSPVTGVGLYRPGNGQFLLKNANVSGAADASFVVTTTGTVVAPVAGDWTRQGFAAVGVVVNVGGTIQFQLRTANTAGAPELRVNYGAPGDVPLIGNWDGQIKLPPVSVP